MKITSARITDMPTSMFDPMPRVYVTTADMREHFLFEYYPDELTFGTHEFIGLTLEQAGRLKMTKDVAFLRS